MIFHDLKVKSLNRLTSDAVEIDFEVPNELKPDFKFKPGQYITLNLDGRRRDYSLCSSPLEGRWSIGIKTVDNGLVSNYLNTRIEKGSTIKVSSPNGRFGIQSRPDVQRSVLAFAAGSGITPILSILKYTLQTEKNVDFYLFYGNRTPEDVMFRKDIDELKIDYPKNFHPYFFYTRHKAEKASFEGRLNPEKLEFILNEIVDLKVVDEVVVCGPNGMVKEITDEFMKAGISKDKIHFELFTAPNQQNTQPEITESAVQLTEVEIELDGESFSMEWDGKKNLVDAMLDAGIDAPHSCKGGICSSCMCRLEEGEVVMGENFVLSDDEVEDGIIVACCSKPKSKKIKVNFDDI